MEPRFNTVSGEDLANLPGYGGQSRTVTLRDADGKVFTMDLGPADVHIDRALSNFVTTYHNGEMAADLVSAPFVVDQASNYFWQFQPDNALATVDGTLVAPGGDYPTIDPSLSPTRYQTNGYTLGAIIPMEVLANQDSGLNLQIRAMKQCMDRLMLNREVRVQAQAFNTASWTGSLVMALTGLQKWNGGSNSDPVANIKALYQASLMPPTHMVMSRQTWDTFVQNPQVQKFVAYKSGAAPIPARNAYGAWAALLDLPEPIIAEAKAKNSAGAYPYVWNGSVALIRTTTSNMEDTASFKTFRWNGAGGPNLPTEFGGTVEGGWTVRQFYDYKRGPRGSQVVVVTHNDAETITGGPGGVSLVGGLITGAYQ